MNIQSIVNQFKESAIWSASDENLYDLYDINDFSDRTNSDILEIVELFMSNLSVGQVKALYDSNETNQIGHWLALEMSGHGSGFYDSINDTVNSISELVECFYKFESVFDMDDHTLEINFFTYSDNKIDTFKKWQKESNIIDYYFS